MERHVPTHATSYTRKRRDRHDPTGKIVCCQCSRFVAKDRIKRHNFIYHSNERPYQCNVIGCEKTFKYVEPYRDHMDKHNNSPRFECEHCGKKFFNSSNLRTHVIRHIDPDKFKCEICDERFGAKNSLKLHKLRKHEENLSNEYFCTFEGCSKSFNFMSNLNNHIRQVHTNLDDAVVRKCEHCEFTCLRQKNLSRHTWKVHKIKKRNHRIFEIEDTEIV